MYYSGVKKYDLDGLLQNELDYETQCSEEDLAALQLDQYYVKPDSKEALKRYLRSGKKGDAEACNCAALIIERENPIEAVNLYKKAIELNPYHSNSMFNMALLYYNKKDEQEWHFEAVKMMRRAAALGSERAVEYLEDRGLEVKDDNILEEIKAAAETINW